MSPTGVGTPHEGGDQNMPINTDPASVAAKPRRDVTFKNALGFGLTDIMGGGSLAIVSAYLLYFFTQFGGLSALEGASILALSRIIDATVSVIMGALSDNFYLTKLGRKFGRRRFFLLIGAPLILLYAVLWVPSMGYWYYLAAYAVVDTLISVISIPWETLPTEMTSDFNKRTLMSTVRLFCSSLATTLSTVLGAFLIRLFGEHNAHAYTALGAVFAVLFSVCVLITYLSTWERPIPPEMMAVQAKSDKSAWQATIQTVWKALKDYGRTFRVKAFRQHLLLYLLGVTAQDMFSLTWVYYVTFALGLTSSFASTLLSLSIIVLIVTPLMGYLFAKLGAKPMYLTAFSLVFLAMLGFYWLYAGEVQGGTLTIMLYVLSIIYQLGKGACFFIPWNVFPSIPDLGRLMYREVREGSYTAVMVFLRKSTSGIASLVVGAWLEAHGFVSQATSQPESAVHSIVMIFVFFIGGLMVLDALVAIRFPMNAHTTHVVSSEIDRLEAGGEKADVDDETKRVCEMLTGHPYETLWPAIPEVDEDLLKADEIGLEGEVD